MCSSDLSGASRGWVALQQFPRTRDVAFAIGDSGVGLRTKLLSKYDCPDDVTAIHLAVQPGVSTSRRNGHGKGLASVRRLAAARAGATHIWTGSAVGNLRAAHQPVNFTRTSPLEGTLVECRLRCG